MNIHTLIISIIRETYKNCSMDPLFLPIAIAIVTATTTTTTPHTHLLQILLQRRRNLWSLIR